MTTDPDDDLAREIRTHLELETEVRIADGARPEDARNAARRAFGNVTRIREDARTAWVRPWADQARQDVTYAVRMLVNNRAFSSAALLTLALGIGATTAIFSVVNAVLWRPLRFADSEQVVRITETVLPSSGAGAAPFLIASEVGALRSSVTALSHVGVHIPTIRTLTGVDEPVRLIGARVSPDLLMMLNTRPQLGRTLERGEDAAGRDDVVVLSHPTWQRHFGGRSEVVGERITLDGRPHRVIGVMPRDFSYLDPRDEFWMPLSQSAPMMKQGLPITARLEDGVSIEAAIAELNAVVPRLHGRLPSAERDGAAAPPRFTVVRLRDLIAAPVKRPLLILGAAVGFVLLIACVNVANLLLARAMARQRELALRLALGAGRGRLIRQALTESILLALLGGIGGIAFAFADVALLRTLATSLPRRDLGPGIGLPRLDEIAVDGAALVFTVVTSIVAGLLFGVLPALRQVRTQPLDALRHGTSGTVTGGAIFGVHRVQHLLVVSQIALAIILLVGGGLLIHSFVRLSNIRPGYDPRHVLTFQVSLPGNRPDVELKRLAAELVQRIKSLPGVTAAGYAEGLPMTRVSARRAALNTTPEPSAPRRRPLTRTFTADVPDTRLVSKEFLTAMGIHVLSGRGFEERDAAGQPAVMLINRTLARSGYLGADPLGKYVYPFGSVPYQIVGIVDDVRQVSLTQSVDPQIFVDFRQIDEAGPLVSVGLYFGVRIDPGSPSVAANIRALVRQLDAEAMIENIAPMEQLVSNSIARPRLYAVMLGIFAAVATILAAVGIYGVMAYAVAQRTREIGVRMSLGASPAHVLGQVLRQSFVLTAAGVLLGLGGAAALTRYLEQLLFELTALDPATFAAVAIFFTAVAMIAAFVPARRAATADPVTALRCE